MTLSVVQTAGTAANGGSTQPVSNWSVAPTNGNLLVAIGYIRQNATPHGINGWSVFSSASTANWFPVCYYKYAHSTPLTEGVDAGTGYQEWGLCFWEFASSTLVPGLNRVSYGGQNTTNQPFPNGPVTTLASTQLALAAYTGQFPSAGQTFNWSLATGWTHGSDYVAPNGDAFGVHNWASNGHQFITGGASVSSSVGASSNANAWTNAIGEITEGPIPKIRVGGGSRETLIAWPSNIRTTALARESLVRNPANLRASVLLRESLATFGGKVRTSAFLRETLVSPFTINVRTSAMVRESLYAPVSHLRATGLLRETLVPGPPQVPVFLQVFT